MATLGAIFLAFAQMLAQQQAQTAEIMFEAQLRDMKGYGKERAGPSGLKCMPKFLMYKGCQHMHAKLKATLLPYMMVVVNRGVAELASWAGA